MGNEPNKQQGQQGQQGQSHQQGQQDSATDKWKQSQTGTNDPNKNMHDTSKKDPSRQPGSGSDQEESDRGEKRRAS